MKTYRFARSLLFWIRGEVSFDDTSIDLELAHCFFVFPIGKHRERIPVDSVSSVGLDLSYNPQMALAALLGVAAGGIVLFLGSWLGILSVLFGALAIPLGLDTKVSIHKSGTTVSFGVPFFERGKIRAMAAELEYCVHRNGENKSHGVDRIVEAIKETR